MISMKTEHKLIWWLKYHMNSIIYFCLHKYNKKMSETPNGSLKDNKVFSFIKQHTWLLKVSRRFSSWCLL